MVIGEIRANNPFSFSSMAARTFSCKDFSSEFYSGSIPNKPRRQLRFAAALLRRRQLVARALFSYRLRALQLSWVRYPIGSRHSR